MNKIQLLERTKSTVLSHDLVKGQECADILDEYIRFGKTYDKIKDMDIVQLRAYTGLSQQKFAKFLEISSRSVESWECGGRNITKEKLEIFKNKIAKKY